MKPKFTLILIKRFALLTLLSALTAPLATAFAQGTAFTYQGRLNDGANPANGIYDLQFTIYDSTNLPGTIVAGPITNSATGISNGLFTASLDFGSAPFAGADRWLEISVRTNAAATFTTISPRQKIAPTPYAITAGNVLGGGLAAGTYGNAVTLNNPANSFSGNGGGLTNVNAATVGGVDVSNLWQLGGNTGNPDTILGTIDSRPLSFFAWNQRLTRLETVQRSTGVASSSVAGNVTAGADANLIWEGVLGGTIAGGGSSDFTFPIGKVPHANTVSDDFGTIGGGVNNLAGNTNSDLTDVSYATVSGGSQNTASGQAAAIGGGVGNLASNQGGTVSGGYDNTNTGLYAVVGGGAFNLAIGGASTIGGGYGNTNSAAYGTVGGGSINQVTGLAATVGGGIGNIATGSASTVSGGQDNLASGYSSTAAGGQDDIAGGQFSFAAGQQAHALHDGSFVWADSQDAIFASTATDQFLVRAVGGVGINKNNPASTLDVAGTSHTQGANNWDVTGTEGDFRVGTDSYRFKLGVAIAGGGAGDVWMRAHGGTGRIFIKTPGGTTIYSNEGQTSGVTLAAGGGAWSNLSDRNSKENFETVDAQEILERVASLPLATWNYKSQEKTVRHIGPMAQDFASAFQVGEDERHITTIDAEGVALAAIKGLNEKMESENATLRAENSELKTRLEKLERLVDSKYGNGE